jgi:AraC-like DNA-binding protein
MLDFTYDSVRNQLQAGAEWDRLNAAEGESIPNWHVDAEGSWKILGWSSALCSLANFQPTRMHVDHLQMDNFITIQFALGGCIDFNMEDGPRYHQAGQRVSFFASPAGTQMKRVITGGEKVQYVGISLPLSDLQQFGFDPSCMHEDLKAFLEGRNQQLFMLDFNFTPQQFAAVNDLLNNKFTGRLRERFVEAKFNELICLAVEQLMSAGSSRWTRSVKARDHQALEIAMQILTTETHEPWSMPDLARRVGLNRNKLATGFKERLGMTPASFARKARLKQAKSLIESSRMSMHEVAWETGFVSQSSFTRAYRLEFGVPPGRHRINKMHN